MKYSTHKKLTQEISDTIYVSVWELNPVLTSLLHTWEWIFNVCAT